MLIVVYFEETQKEKIANAIGAIFILAVAYFTENRSKISGKAEDDDTYRKSEMMTIGLIAWSFPIIAPIKKHLGHFGIDALFSVLPLVIFITFLNSPIYKKIMNKTPS